jgi:hypothetical protein
MSKGYTGTFKADIIFNSFTRNIKTPHEEYKDSIQSGIEERRAQMAKPVQLISNGKTLTFGTKQTGKLVYSTNPETRF